MQQHQLNIFVFPCYYFIQTVGMAYSMLAGLPPVYGVYVSFVAPLLYAIFGRCAQLSLGKLDFGDLTVG